MKKSYLFECLNLLKDLNFIERFKVLFLRLCIDIIKLILLVIIYIKIKKLIN